MIENGVGSFCLSQSCYLYVSIFTRYRAMLVQFIRTCGRRFQFEHGFRTHLWILQIINIHISTISQAVRKSIASNVAVRFGKFSATRCHHYNYLDTRLTKSSSDHDPVQAQILRAPKRWLRRQPGITGWDDETNTVLVDWATHSDIGKFACSYYT